MVIVLYMYSFNSEINAQNRQKAHFYCSSLSVF